MQEKDFEVFKEFDVVYTHLVSIHSIGKWKWWEFPIAIKKICGKDAPKVMMSIDAEMSYVPPPDTIKRALDASDLIACVTKPCLDDWHKYTKTPVCYIPAPKYYHLVRDPTPIEQRKKTVAILRHTWVPNDETTGIKTQCKVVGRGGWDCKIFTGWFSENAGKIRNWAVKFGINQNKVKTFTRLSRVPYFDELSQCYVGLEDEYIGASRFSAECSALKIPVLGTDYITGAKVANPDLVTKRRDIDGKVALIKRLFEDKEFYKEQSELASKNHLHHYNSAVCLDRLLDAWRLAKVI